VRALVAPGSLKSDSHSQGCNRSRALIDLGAEVTEFDPMGSSQHHILDKVLFPDALEVLVFLLA